MKLCEISLSQDVKEMNDIEAITTTFKKYGWEFKGSGSDSAVGKNPTKNYVVKVFRKDSAYNEFVKLAISHPNPHFSQFFGNVKTVPQNMEWSFVRIENLTPIEGNIYEKYPSELFYLCEMTYKFNLPLKLGRSTTYKLEIVAAEIAGISLIVNNTFNEKIWDKVPKPSQLWMKACELVVSKAQESNFVYIDAQEDNFMLRKNILVFIDPYWN